MAKKKYLVDVYRELAQTVEVEADSPEDAHVKAYELAEGDKLEWRLDMLTWDSAECSVCGYVDEKGERQYY